VSVLVQFLELRQRLHDFALDASTPDHLEWKWSSSVQYSAGSAYKVLFFGQHAVEGSKELWRIRASNKCKFFLWLVLLGRCWTSEQLQ
jgi:hypothetical protein